ncbi:3-hydroxyisobutyrate dehydrogenase-like beta-hydroxyacid dehydrogenase [Nocardiopsis mwathae]|uniref:3-hydroxyisobutyrate dehydrogenase-like beta-hydroxyacid dehydrogenase n=1 Tax=Nocardiopsis mwathae TaxID=1472723 RepID=A0A7X0D5G4_9ACTN|nr:NAD(P)-binding domain-containing protein [Nocardiopsis mwathae]MBB6171094.1 3-hydroxyisobutyrate dehydrogenase-like beta-hydroxyacid dehydrogenase [Nocardiopsis mwathae]
MTETNPVPVSVIGLGAMGSVLATALIENGHPTTVWNRSPEKADPLVEQGAARATTVTEAVQASPLVIVCVLDYKAMYELLDPLCDALAGRVLVNLTTGTPEQAREAAAWATHRTIDYLDGAIMATPPAIGRPDAFLLYSGSQSAFERHEATLKLFGDASTYFGADPGLAALYDIGLLTSMYMSFTGFLYGAALVGTADVKATAFAPYVESFLDGVVRGGMGQLAQQIDEGHYPDDASPLAMQAAGMTTFIKAFQDEGIDVEILQHIKGLTDRTVADGHTKAGLASLIEQIRTRRLVP